jgi:hypothetical protein
MSLRESSTHQPREKWPLKFDLEGTPRDRKEREILLREYKELQESGEEMAPQNNFNPMNDNVFDLGQKVKVPYAHQEYPKMLHSTDYDPAVDKRIKEIAMHNATLRDPMQCRVLPERSRLFKIVQNEREEKAALKEGWMLRPPVEEPREATA